MDETDPDTGESLQARTQWPPDFPAGLPDVLSCSNDTIYMGIQPFSLDGKRREVYYPDRRSYPVHDRDAKPMRRRPDGRDLHLFSTIGFLDDSEMQRSVWMYGKDSFGGCWAFPIPTFVNPSGNILSVKGDSVYGYGRETYNEGRQPTMHLFAAARDPETVDFETRFKGKRVERRGPNISKGVATAPVCRWSRSIGTHVRALMVSASRDERGPDLVFAVGAPEIIDEYDAIDLIRKQQGEGLDVGKIYLKERSMAGELGAKLMVVSAADGEVISEIGLDRPAVFDGMSAAYGRIFIADVEGNVVCLRPAKGE